MNEALIDTRLICDRTVQHTGLEFGRGACAVRRSAMLALPLYRLETQAEVASTYLVDAWTSTSSVLPLWARSTLIIPISVWC